MILNFMPDIRKWILPALLAIVCQQSIHWVIDFSLGNMEVIPIQHLKELIIAIPLFYYGNWRMHAYIEKEIYYDKFYSGLLKEYLLWTFYFVLGIIVYVFYTHRLLNAPDYFMNYLVAVIACLPILLFYYTLIRAEYNKRKFESLILELKKVNTAKAEAELRERLYESKLDFFTDIAHEFSTPLTLISGPCKLILEQKNVNPQTIKYVHVINRNAKRMNLLISDLMDFKQMESGYKRPEVTSLNVSEIADRVIEAFKVDTSGSEISLIRQYEPDIFWNSDEKFLTTILINLVSNAVKYSNEEPVTVDISTENGSLRILVVNKGKGISKEDIGHIFNRFTVLDNYGKQKGWKRNGLGLAITAGMVKLLSGNINARSIPGETTTFTVDLPPLQVTKTEKDNAMGTISNSLIPEFVLPPIKYKYIEDRPTVTVIDDDPEMLWYICDLLSSDFNVLPINNSSKAIDILSNNHTDIILCDIMMEEIDGITLAALLKSDKSTSHIPLIIISAVHDIKVQTEAIQAGAEFYITKPFDSEYLKTTIRGHLNRKEDLKDYFASPLSAYELDMGKLQHAEDRKFLKKIHAIINKNIQNEKLSPDFIANELGMSVRSLYRKLKEVTDKGLQEIIYDGKLAVAENLLLKSKFTIHEIVFKSGFSNRTSFYRAFLKKNGCTPKEFIEVNKGR